MRNAFERHLREPHARGPVPDGAAVGSAGGSVCGDLVRIALRADGGRLCEITFDAEGCGATVAAASACVTLAEGRPLLEIASLGSEEIARELGRTPNPCVRCNGLVRFDAMLALAERAGAGALVTGHYARIEQDSEGPLLARAAYGSKDQSYMLAGLRPALLERVRFPLGDL